MITIIIYMVNVVLTTTSKYDDRAPRSKTHLEINYSGPESALHEIMRYNHERKQAGVCTSMVMKQSFPTT
jgi:hypothetical protein